MSKLFHQRKLRPRGSTFRGRSWEPLDLEALASMVALLALGQCSHVERLLRSSAVAEAIPADYAITAAIKSLSVTTGRDPWHRDGWVFQLVSWLAAVEESSAITRAPQMDQASKGFDGFQIEVDSKTGSIIRAVVFEDKATSSPRDTVRDKIWPEFADIEAQNRHPAIAVEISALLKGIVTDAEIPDAVDRILRDPEGLAYRASVTTRNHATLQDYGGLFDGFENAVPGHRRRRRANVLEVSDLRTWVDDLCARAVAILEADRV